MYSQKRKTMTLSQLKKLADKAKYGEQLTDTYSVASLEIIKWFNNKWEKVVNDSFIGNILISKQNGVEEIVVIPFCSKKLKTYKGVSMVDYLSDKI